jgi:hypothetical protein
MTGYQSKKAAALDEEGMYLVHHTKRKDDDDDDTQVYKRPWVDLTDEDVAEVERWVEFKEEGSGRIPTGKLVTYINNKLKEKNNAA